MNEVLPTYREVIPHLESLFKNPRLAPGNKYHIAAILKEAQIALQDFEAAVEWRTQQKKLAELFNLIPKTQQKPVKVEGEGYETTMYCYRVDLLRDDALDIAHRRRESQYYVAEEVGDVWAILQEELANDKSAEIELIHREEPIFAILRKTPTT